MGGSQPFTTQESDDEDMFTPIRTQSGYLRIIDNGKDANGNAWDWKDLIPATDTSRPVTLTAGGTVVWQGFMQAQDFGSVLYGNPQEREYPIQCGLSVLQGSDIDSTNKTIQNLAYVLRECVTEIDVLSGGVVTDHVLSTAGVVHINKIAIQGGVDARRWLLKRVDWQNFLEDNDGEFEAKYNLYEILQDICKFWGWTARTDGKNLYLTRADDLDMPTWAVLTRAQLDALASGTDASSIMSFDTLTLDGSEFATTENDDYRQRGHNKSKVKVNANQADENVIEFDEKLEELMADQGVSSETYSQDGKMVNYTNDLLTFSRPLLIGTAVDGKASFNLGQIYDTLFGQPSYDKLFLTHHVANSECRLNVTHVKSVAVKHRNRKSQQITPVKSADDNT